MNILIFIIVLETLIFVHELGHFLFAKLFNIRVDEFGFGYPPKALTLGYFKETKITLNWIPFGGFVRIHGEDGDGKESHDSLVSKSKPKQFLVMAGGIIFNIIFAWILLSSSYMLGIQSSVDSAPDGYVFENTALTVTSVSPESPASLAGLLPGDAVLEYQSPDTQVFVEDEGTEVFSNFINEAGSKGHSVDIAVLRDERIEKISLIPEEGIIENRFGIGVGIDQIGEVRLGFFNALYHGLINTFVFLGAITEGFISLISGSVPLDAVSGPVGIVSQVGQASSLGLTYLLGFTALLSLNLAVLNAFPFPALDGGKIVVIGIESVLKKPLPVQAVNWVNAIGFIILILFMIVITIKDIFVLI